MAEKIQRKKERRHRKKETTYSSLNSIALQALGMKRSVTTDRSAAWIMLDSGVASTREFAVEISVQMLWVSRRVVSAEMLA